MAARARASDAKADQRRASMHQREKAAWVSVVESIGRAKADVMVAKMSWFSVDDFKKADSDNSGEIQQWEYMALWRKTLFVRKTTLSDADLQLLWRIADVNNSGAISLSEFTTLVQVLAAWRDGGGAAAVASAAAAPALAPSKEDDERGPTRTNGGGGGAHDGAKSAARVPHPPAQPAPTAAPSRARSTEPKAPTTVHAQHSNPQAPTDAEAALASPRRTEAAEEAEMVQAAATTLQEYGPMRTAMEKISSAAMIAHDRGHGSEVFKDGCPLDVAAFAGLLRRNFGLKLSPAELGALLVLFDRDGDGTISCDEFKSMWMRLGRAQRSRERKHRSDEAVQARAREDKRLRSHLRKHRPERHKVASAFTEADTDRALKKIYASAQHYDPHRGGIGLNGFGGKYMTIEAFYEQLRANFGIRLNAAELAAMAHRFNARKDADGITVQQAEAASSMHEVQVQAREIMRYADRMASNGQLTVLEIQTMLNGTKYEAFATFLTQDHAKVMLAHDTDHSHSISISELEKVRALPPPPSHPLRSEFLPR